MASGASAPYLPCPSESGPSTEGHEAEVAASRPTGPEIIDKDNVVGLVPYSATAPYMEGYIRNYHLGRDTTERGTVIFLEQPRIA